jgi:Zn-finger nucleic acid-binding protein
MFADLLGGDVQVVDDTPTERKCPCCSERLRACRISVDGIDLEHDTLHCKLDGIWLAGGLLEHILHAQSVNSHRDFPSDKPFVAPGEYDVEIKARRDELHMRIRDYAQVAYLGLGFVLAFSAVFSAGWWCVAFMVVAGVFFRWYLERAKRLSPEQQALADLREQVAANLLVN